MYNYTKVTVYNMFCVFLTESQLCVMRRLASIPNGNGRRICWMNLRRQLITTRHLLLLSARPSVTNQRKSSNPEGECCYVINPPVVLRSRKDRRKEMRKEENRKEVRREGGRKGGRREGRKEGSKGVRTKRGRNLGEKEERKERSKEGGREERRKEARMEAGGSKERGKKEGKKEQSKETGSI